MMEPVKRHPDPDRQEAERLAASLAGELRRSAEFVERLTALSDDELRAEIVRLKLTKRHPGATAWPKPKLSTLKALLERANHFGATDRKLDAQAVADRLDREFGLQVADDGLIEADRITPRLATLVGDLPIAVYHHTAAVLLPQIAEQGLKVGRQTNFFNTQAGVYLSTRRAGEPVEIYSRRAAYLHGGQPTVIRVRRLLSQLTPDPDDADLAWAQGVQFISDPVPPQDILLDVDQVVPKKRPRPR